VADTADQTREDTVQKLVDRAMDVFGGFDSACIRTGAHGIGNILESTTEDCDIQYEGNFRSVFFALKALLPPLVEQRSGQVVINTSASALRPQGFAALYCASRAGANALVQAAALTVAQYGVTLNGTGTYAMDYPSFLRDVGADTDPEKLREIEQALPLKKLCDPEEAAHFIATLIDGRGTFQTAQFFAIDGGWSLM
jgi:glucose 1-dehydrogenase